MNQSRHSQTAASGRSRQRVGKSEIFGYLEVCVFALIFILVFSLIARADRTPATSSSGVGSSNLSESESMDRGETGAGQKP